MFTRSQKKGRGKGAGFKKKLFSVDSLYTVERGAIITDFVRHPLGGKPLARVRNPDGGIKFVVATRGMSTETVFGENLHIRRLGDLREGTKICAIYPRLGVAGLLTSPGSSGEYLGKRGELYTIRVSRRLISLKDGICIQGEVGGGGFKFKPMLKAGKRFYIMRARRKSYPSVSPHKMNVHESLTGGKFRKARGRPTTISRRKGPGAKTGNIAARRTGRCR